MRTRVRAAPIIGPRTASVLAALLAATLVAGTGAPPARATDPSTVNQAIAEQERMQEELERDNAQLVALREAEARLDGQLTGLRDELARVGVEVEAARQRVAQVTVQLERERATLARVRDSIARLETDLVTIADRIVASEADLARREAQLEDHLRDTYEQSRISLLEMLMAANSLGEAANQLGYLLALSDEDKRLADEVKGIRRRLEIQRDTLHEGRAHYAVLEAEAAESERSLAAQQAEFDAARVGLEALQAELDRYRLEQEAALADIRQNEEEYQRLIEAHERALEGQRALVEELKEEARRLDLAFRGRFAWPVKGNFIVTQEFGATHFNHFHSGIDMAYLSPASCAGPIYAVADGVVLAEGQPNVAYGDAAVGVVIGHSQTLQSWYWHLSGELVAKGQEVRAGDLIGYEGATGIATGCHLHFEVLKDGVSVNPRLYLP